MKILLIFTLCLISDGGASKEVTGYSGGGILIKCKYDTAYKDKQKYFCKGSMPGCLDQIKTGDKNQWVNSGRFSLFDDTKSSEFWVMFRELTVQDTGTYQCGVDKTLVKDIYTPVELKVKEGSLVSREVTAYAGGRINIKYRYEDEYKDKLKSFCKIGTHQWCFNQKQPKLNSEWSHDGKFSIHDNRSAGFFSVFIIELIIEDTGTYACGGLVSDKLAVYTVVTLNVTEGLSYEKSISETVHVGGDLTVRCKYPQSLRSDPKFLCRRTQDFACFYKDSVKDTRKNITFGKFSLYDDREKQIFTVNIRNVTKQDSEYWCGAEKNWTSDHGYKVYFTRINLTVTEQYVPVSTSKRTHPSFSSSPSSSSSSSTSSPLLRLTDKNKSRTSSASPPAGFPASTVITVSVILLLLLIGTITVFMALQKRQKLQDSASTTSSQDPGNQVVPLDICEYEEIKDSRRLSASNAGNFTIYSTAELPTIPSDHHTVYANSKLPTSPYDSAVYPTAQLPTIHSDQDIYSTAQLPTRLSAAESDEGLNYTSVSFHAKSTSSNDAAAKIIFKKTEVLCDYDSLSHVTSSG
ncbi:polymeric immunoglobulin receptor-like isoform X2 [Tachysurus fulvidraco]|uniref:polymeric immunoglobulin receptor-like isoform X2 n=1 Tax=Tachysurus fulvidraco TaxID=1234273 RepID=UPI001FEFB617|nr:polymeric immunoglobulin receptor-like isoform X2 [Tachysurus fulvidraco]